MCQTPRCWPPQPLVPRCPCDVPVPPTQHGADLHAVSAPLLPAYPAPVPASASVAACDYVPCTPSLAGPRTSCHNRAPTWSCLRGCGFEHSSYVAVKKHKQCCQALVHLIEQAPSADLQAEQCSSGCSTAPELTSSSAAVGSQNALST